MKVFPEFEIIEDNDRCIFKTYIRKLHDDDKYYLTLVYANCELSKKADLIHKFIIDAYYIDTAEKFSIGINTLDANGDRIYQVDENQDPENIRLERLIYIY